MKPLLFLLSYIVFAVAVYGQRLNVWAFSDSTGVDFTGGQPVSFKSGINTEEGCASICDAAGQLLFYTDGTRIWNRSHQLMPNAANIIDLVDPNGQPTTSSTTQSSLIVPMPDSAHKYYVFSLTASEDILDDTVQGVPVFKRGRLYYSVVNMNLDGGSGDVDIAQKAVFLDSSLSEGLGGVVGDRCNIWVVTRSYIDFRFKAFQITATGVDRLPVVSGNALPFNPNITASQGSIAFSWNRKKLAITHILRIVGSVNQPSFLELYDFDLISGVVSNRILLDTTTSSKIYGVCFSPNSTKLYSSAMYSIFQYDLSLGTPSAVFVGSPLHEISSLQLAPDQKIYFRSDAATLGAIDSPDKAFPDCEFNPNAAPLTPNSNATISLGLPNVVPELIKDTIHNRFKVTLCRGTTRTLKISDLDAWDIVWNDSIASPQREVLLPGVYMVQYHTAPCVFHTDTFDVVAVDASVSLGNDTVTCGEPVLLQVPLEDAFYQWPDGSRENSYKVTQTGTYWITVIKDNCVDADTINVTIKRLQQDQPEDKIICNGETIRLEVFPPDGATVQWSTGSNTSGINVTKGGSYSVVIIDTPCVFNTTINVTEQYCSCNISVPSAFSPNNDGKNDLFRAVLPLGCPVKGYTMQVYNRWGEEVYKNMGFIENYGWDGTIKGEPAENGVYMYMITLSAGMDLLQKSFKGDITLIR